MVEYNYINDGSPDGFFSHYQEYTVPNDVYYLDVACYGASGGTQSYSGRGGYIKGRISVTPGEVLRVYVGGSPASSTEDSIIGGFNGGGWGQTCPGGGASDVRRAPYELEDRLIVAGGGGGFGLSGSPNFTPRPGGDGGYPTGTEGASNGGNTSRIGGFPGTQTEPGLGGDYASSNPEAGDGDFGQGGYGYPGQVTVLSNFSGGGGGGWYGGGGGGQLSGGGGGSSSVPGGTLLEHETGANLGHGLVIIEDVPSVVDFTYTQINNTDYTVVAPEYMYVPPVPWVYPQIFGSFFATYEWSTFGVLYIPYVTGEAIRVVFAPNAALNEHTRFFVRLVSGDKATQEFAIYGNTPEGDVVSPCAIHWLHGFPIGSSGHTVSIEGRLDSTNATGQAGPLLFGGVVLAHSLLPDATTSGVATSLLPNIFDPSGDFV